MEQTYKVNVTKKDIARAIKIREESNVHEEWNNITSYCPIALAFQRATKNKKAYWAFTTGGVEEDAIEYKADKYYETLRLVNAFDRSDYEGLEPLTFTAVLIEGNE